MPTGQEYSAEVKTIFFRVIDFFEKERDGPMIPLSLTTARLIAVLGVSERSLFNLKAEMKQLSEEQELLNRKEATEVRQLRSRASSSASATSKSPPVVRSHRLRQFSTASITQTSFVTVPSPLPPKKISNSGRRRILLSEAEEDEIRFTFHLLLSQKTYPTTQILLDHLLALHPDFPIASRASLWRYMKKIGFRFKGTSKVKIALDNISFVAQRAHFFRKMDELRRSNAKVFFHDETWTNASDERRSVWMNDQGVGRLKKNEGKGKLSMLLSHYSEDTRNELASKERGEKIISNRITLKNNFTRTEDRVLSALSGSRTRAIIVQLSLNLSH